MQATETPARRPSGDQLPLDLDFSRPETWPVTYDYDTALFAKTPCGQCGGSGTVWVRRNGRNVETTCGGCNGEGEL